MTKTDDIFRLIEPHMSQAIAQKVELARAAVLLDLADVAERERVFSTFGLMVAHLNRRGFSYEAIGQRIGVKKQRVHAIKIDPNTQISFESGQKLVQMYAEFVVNAIRPTPRPESRRTVVNQT